MQEEIWKDVYGLEDVAKVSNLGRVKTKDRYVNNNGTMVLKKGIFRKPINNGLGYQQLAFSINGKVTRKYVHRMVAETFLGYNSDLEINHIDHNKSNNKVSNLEWVSHSENANQMVKFYGKESITYYCKCGNKKYKKAKYCLKCSSVNSRKTERPTKEQLFDLIVNLSFSYIGELYGVKDNTIRSWCKCYGLPYRKKELNKLKVSK